MVMVVSPIVYDSPTFSRTASLEGAEAAKQGTDSARQRAVARAVAINFLIFFMIAPFIFIRLILGSVVRVLAFIVHWSHRQSGVFIIRSNTIWHSTLIPRGYIPLGLHMQTRRYPLYGHVAVFETLCFVIPLTE